MILVTGGTGMLGSNLLFALSAEAEALVATYRDEHTQKKVRALFIQLDPQTGEERYRKINWKHCDILDVITLQEVMQGVRLVYHCAAMVSYRRRDFIRMMKINGEGTANVVNAALEAGVQHFCHVSSTAAVGKTVDKGIYRVVESNKWTQDKRTSGYAISKYTGEKEVWRGIEEGLSAVIINPSVIFGAGHWDDSSLTIFRTMAKGLKFYTAGSNAFVDVRDVVHAMQALAASPISGQRYLCTGNNIAFYELFKLIAKEMKVKPPQWKAGRLLSGIAWRLDSLIAVFTGKQTLTKESVQSAQSRVEYDSSKLTKAFGVSFTPLEETIRYTVSQRVKT